MMIKKIVYFLMAGLLAASPFASAQGLESDAHNAYFSEDEGLNLKEFNSGESFYLWTTFSVKVA